MKNIAVTTCTIVALAAIGIFGCAGPLTGAGATVTKDPATGKWSVNGSVTFGPQPPTTPPPAPVAVSDSADTKAESGGTVDPESEAVAADSAAARGLRDDTAPTLPASPPDRKLPVTVPAAPVP